MKDLAEKVDSRVTRLELLDSDSSDEDDDSDSSEETSLSKPVKTTKRSKGKLKSGKEAKVTSTVLYPQSWPHSFLSLTQARSEVKYDDLTLEEFVAGYGQILLCPDMSEMERTARLRHLISLMYFAQQFEWSAVLRFHGAVLLEIERGWLKWGDSFLPLESRTLYGHLKGKTSTVSATPKISTPVLFCRDYQSDKCTHSQDHFGYIRGERKWLKHICASCWTTNRQQEHHREKSSECPLYQAASKPTKNS